MKDIILSTLNARYSHASLGLRCLFANLGELQTRSVIKEFTIAMKTLDIAEQLLENQPKIIGLGVYIWNIRETTDLVVLLKSLAPSIKIILGGPEVSYEQRNQTICQLADHVITGQGETSFRQVCEQLLRGQKPLEKILTGISTPLDQLVSPYPYYTDEDLQNRFIYVEASRGCPFKCEFCLSSLDKTAYPFGIASFLEDMHTLRQRGLRNFKFVDRTFNLKIATTNRILDFFLERLDKDTFLHFELIPDHLPDALKDRIKAFPAGSLQFEIGVQSFNPDVQELISRKQNNEKTRENIRWLRTETHAHLHTDLIFGLPGEDLASFAKGFDTLISLQPHEIQVGILKRLRGTPIIRHTEHFGMIYNPQPPYNILCTDRIDYTTMQHMNRFARYWDMIGNSGRFENTLPLLLGEHPFERFFSLSQALYTESGQTHQIALPRLFKLVHALGISQLALPKDTLEAALLTDYAQTGQKGAIPFLPGQTLGKQRTLTRQQGQDGRNQRQRRHQSGLSDSSRASH